MFNKLPTKSVYFTLPLYDRINVSPTRISYLRWVIVSVFMRIRNNGNSLISINNILDKTIYLENDKNAENKDTNFRATPNIGRKRWQIAKAMNQNPIIRIKERSYIKNQVECWILEICHICIVVLVQCSTDYNRRYIGFGFKLARKRYIKIEAAKTFSGLYSLSRFMWIFLATFERFIRTFIETFR